MSKAADAGGADDPYGSLDELKQELEDRSLLDYMVEHTDGETEIPYKADTVDEDAYLQAVLDIHFDETYGTPYWREQMEDLDVDPREAIETVDDLAMLGEADEEALKHRPVEDFMPRLFHKGAADAEGTYESLEPDPGYFDMSKSSGTTGKKKIMPWRKAVSDEVVEWYHEVMDMEGTENGNWLVNGPYGLFEKLMTDFVEERGGVPHFVGIETKHYKDQAAALGEFSEASLLGKAKQAIFETDTVINAFKAMARMEPTMDVIENVLKSEEIENMATTYEVAEQAHRYLSSDATVSDPEDIDTILVGLAVSDEQLESLAEMYENADVVSMYATSFTGAAFDDTLDDELTYHHISPLVEFEMLGEGNSLEEREEVEYGERGQVMFQRIGEGFFWPNQVERESAIRKDPRFKGGTDGMSDIRHDI